MSVSKETIAILIPSKDRRVLLERALKSVFAQTVPPEEIIVVNDGSSDGTKEFLDEVVKLHSNVKVLHRSINGGVNRARHDGIAVAVSKWIAGLDDDDEFLPDAIFHIKNKLAEVPENYGIVYFNSIITTDNGTKNGGFQFQGEKFYDLSYDEMMVKHRIRGDCKAVFRKTLFDEGYSFPLHINGLESYLIYLVARDGKGIRCYPEVTTHIYFDSSVQHLSHTGPRKNPWPLFVIHAKQIPQHAWFYVRHPIFLVRKFIEMGKLLVRSAEALL